MQQDLALTIESVVALPESLHEELVAYVEQGRRDYNSVVAQAIRTYLSVAKSLEDFDVENQDQ